MSTPSLRSKLEQQLGWIILVVLLGGCLFVARVSSIDNFVKPWIISQGSAMPFLLSTENVQREKLDGRVAFVWMIKEPPSLPLRFCG
jgi:hypothetical protein